MQEDLWEQIRRVNLDRYKRKNLSEFLVLESFPSKGCLHIRYLLFQIVMMRNYMRLLCQQKMLEQAEKIKGTKFGSVKQTVEKYSR